MVRYYFLLLFTAFFFADSAYTERYMGMPDTRDNWEGYEMADLTK